MIKFYGVLDSDGTKINTILIDDEKLEGYYPGYGFKLIDEGEAPQEPKADPIPPKPSDFGVLDVKLTEPMLIGDRIDFKTLEVIKRKEAIDIISVSVEDLKLNG